VWALEIAPASGRLYAGGDFTQIGNGTYQRFARFTDQPDCTVTGTSSDDVLEGSEEADVICAGGGNDTIKGLGGDDVLKGEAGWDRLHGGEGDDTLVGGIGTDLASYASSTMPVSASLEANGATGEGTDSFVDIENLEGSNLDDTITGSEAANRLIGLGGADGIFGLGGGDTFLGGAGEDDLRGGSGEDSVTGGGSADLIYGGKGDDTLDSRDNAARGNDSLDGGTHVNGDTCLTDATEKSVVECER
jgi:Ca2+-binding RTX toxin-like protein